MSAPATVDIGEAMRAIAVMQARIADMLYYDYKVTVIALPMQPRTTLLPRVIRIPYDLARGQSMRYVQRYHREIAIAVGKKDCRIELDERGTLWIVFTRDNPETVRLVDVVAKMPALQPGRAAVGINESGKPISMSLVDDLEPTRLLIGVTGSGKSVTMLTMVTSFAYYTPADHAKMLILDPKKSGENFGVFGLPTADAWLEHLLHPVVRDFDEMARVVRWVREQTMTRTHPNPRLLLVIDEIWTLINTVDGIDADLDHIARFGRSAGVHIMASSQRADTSALGKLAGSMGFRVVFQTVGDQHAYMSALVAGSGANRLGKRGDMMIGKETIPVQGYFVDYADIKTLLAGSFTTTRPELDFGSVPEPSVPEPRAPGRPRNDPTPDEVALVLKYRATHKLWPSATQIRNGAFGQTMGMARAKRLLEMAHDAANDVTGEDNTGENDTGEDDE